MFAVYRISGPNSHFTYIGYCDVGDGSDPHLHQQQFLVGASRPDEERGDVRFLAEHDADPASLYGLVLSVHDNEWEAFLERNEQRSIDPHSFTGPSVFPPGAYERASKEQPAKVLAADKRWRARALSTAREAWAIGLWTNAQIKKLATVCSKEAIIRDLDKLTPSQFMVKYELVPVEQEAVC